MTVQELRNAGYKVRVLHNRLYNGKFKWEAVNYRSSNRVSDVMSSDTKGGSTSVIIDSPDGYHFEGHAVCSNKENYDKKLGVRIAVGRSGVLNHFTKTLQLS